MLREHINLLTTFESTRILNDLYNIGKTRFNNDAISKQRPKDDNMLNQMIVCINGKYDCTISK